MKKILLFAALLLAISAKAQETPKVYFTKEISPESLVNIFKTLGVEPVGNVCVKISTGEGGNTHYLKPELIGELVKTVDGTIVECCTAYGGTRQDPKKHWETIRDHGFDKIAKVDSPTARDYCAVDLMDEFGEMQIPVKDSTHIKHDIVGEHLQNYDFMINLAHFKGHAMGGFGGVLKNASIGVASTRGKIYIHSAGASTTNWGRPKQDHFLESMAAAAQAVHDYMNAKSQDGTPRVVYINVLNNLSVDCDCDGHPAAPEMKDLGIAAALIRRINRQHGTHITPYAESIGLGSTKYELVNIDEK